MAMNCSGCGAELFSGQRFCNQCGRPAAQVQLNDPPVQRMPPSAVAPDDTPQYGDAGATDPAPGNMPPAPAQPWPDAQYPPADYWAGRPVYQPLPVQPGYPTPYAVPNLPRTNQTAIVALILSIFGLVCFGIIMEPIAVFLAIKAKREIAADPLQTGNGMATAALVIGIIVGLIYVGFVTLMVVGFVTGALK